MTFSFEDETMKYSNFPCLEIFSSVAETVLKAENCPFEAEVNLTLVDKESIQELNKEHRGIDRVTDVLSFPLTDFEIPGDFSKLDEKSADCFNPGSKELLLGDIVICMERAKEQAEEYGHSLKREFAFLIAHSMLHLLGFDHEDPEEEKIMFQKQEQALSNLGILRE